jgi:MOSC domain-containing protein YiiM
MQASSPPARVVSVQVGPIAPLGPKAVPSAFIKRPVAGPVEVRALGLAGDAQADLRVHGGPDKAVYAYAEAHYPAWAADFPEHAGRLDPGAFGENLTVAGLDESQICVGDIHAIGTARLQVCQPRQPCFKFALRFQDNRMPKAMVRNGRAGWYYRVLTPGVMAAGDPVRHVERPHPAFPLPRLIEIVNLRAATAEELELLAGMGGVADNIRNEARETLPKQASA